MDEYDITNYDMCSGENEEVIDLDPNIDWSDNDHQ